MNLTRVGREMVRGVVEGRSRDECGMCESGRITEKRGVSKVRIVCLVFRPLGFS